MKTNRFMFIESFYTNITFFTLNKRLRTGARMLIIKIDHKIDATPISDCRKTNFIVQQYDFQLTDFSQIGRSHRLVKWWLHFSELEKYYRFTTTNRMVLNLMILSGQFISPLCKINCFGNLHHNSSKFWRVVWVAAPSCW